MLTESFFKKIDVLSGALEKATERSRTMKYVCMFASMILLIASFNSFLSWDRKINGEDRELFSLELKTIPPLIAEPYNKQLIDSLSGLDDSIAREKFYSIISNKNLKGTDKVARLFNVADGNDYFKNSQCKKAFLSYLDSLDKRHLLYPQIEYSKWYFERQKFFIPIIGLSCYSDDLIIIGSSCLAVVITYFFFLARKVNKLIESFKNEFLYLRTDFMKHYVLENPAITSPELSTMQKELVYLSVINYAFYAVSSHLIFFNGKNAYDYRQNGQPAKNTSGRFFINAMYYVPACALLVSLLIDFLSAIIRWEFLSANNLVEIVLRYSYFGLMFYVVARQTIGLTILQREDEDFVNTIHSITDEKRQYFSRISIVSPDQDSLNDELP